MKKFMKQNKSLFILSLVLVLWSILLAWCNVQLEKEMNDSNDIMVIEKQKMIKDVVQWSEKIEIDEMKSVMDENLDKEMTLWYLDYDPILVEKSLAKGVDVVLFFHASRCSSCRRLHKNLIAEISDIPQNVQIFRLDYDNEKELRKKYGITSQHTLVALNSDGSLKNKVVWANDLNDVLNLLK